MSKYLIFGGNGMLAHAFRENKFFADNVAVDIQECDITDYHAVERVVNKHKPQYLINCAAFTDVTLSETNFDHAMSVNADGAKNLALVANAHSCKLIHFSTDYVFKGDEDIAYTEDATPDPVNIYGLSKLRGEENIVVVNPQALIIRVSWLYGKHGKNFASTISQMMRKQREISVVYDQYGRTTYTPDAVEAVRHLIDANADGIYHFANEGVCTRYEFTMKIYEILSRKERIECAILPIAAAEYMDMTPRPTHSVLSTQKYCFFTNEKIRHWEDALEDYLCK